MEGECNDSGRGQGVSKVLGERTPGRRAAVGSWMNRGTELALEQVTILERRLETVQLIRYVRGSRVGSDGS